MDKNCPMNKGRTALASSILISLVAAYSLALGFGLGTQRGLSTFFADDWMWVNDVFTHGWIGGSVCNHFGHPVVLPNLHLLINYHLFNASATGRAVVVMAAFLASVLGIAHLAMRGISLPAHKRIAVYMVFACAAIWGGLGNKLWWSFGLTDALALLGAVIAAFGLVILLETKERGRTALLLMIGGGLIGTFSFGTGYVIWPAFAIVMAASRVPWRWTVLFLVVGLAAVSIAAFALPSCVPDVGNGVTKNMLRALSATPVSTIMGAAATLGFLPAHALVLRPELGTEDLFCLWAVVGFALVATLLIVGCRIVLRRERDAAIAAFAALAAVSVGAVILLGLARPGSGAAGSYIPRHAPLVMPLWLGLFAICVRMLLKRATPVLIALLLVVASGFLYSNFRWSILRYYASPAATVAALGLLVEPTTDSPSIRFLFHRPELPLRSLARLKEDGRGYFGTDMAEAAKGLGSSPGARTDDSVCRGTMQPGNFFRSHTSQDFNGWAIGPRSDRVSYLEAYFREQLIGLAARSGSAEGRSGDSVFASIPGVRGAYNMEPGFVGLVNLPKQAKIEDVRWICVTSEGKRHWLSM